MNSEMQTYRTFFLTSYAFRSKVLSLSQCQKDPGSGIRDPGSGKNLSWIRIQGVKSNGSQIWIRNTAPDNNINSPDNILMVEPGEEFDPVENLIIKLQYQLT
jgi:hypothetical protein